MKVQFHLKGQNQPLYYPENAADVTMEEFIYFHKNLLPNYPVIEIEALQIQNVMDETYEKIKQYAKKLKVDLRQGRADVMLELEHILIKDKEMKVQFHLRGNNQPLYYPENAADVTMEEFIYFHKNLLPRYPVIEIEALQIQNVMDETYEKIKQYAKKLKVDLRQGRADVMLELEHILIKDEVKDNVRRFLPSLLKTYNDNVDKFLEKMEIMDDVWLSEVKYPFMADVVHYFTKIPLSACYGRVAESLELKYLKFFFDKIMNAMTQPDELKYKQIYEFNNKIYILPDKLMAKSTLLEFAEAAQFDKSRKQIENNESEGLLRMVAVLLRENGEEYNEFVFEKNMVDFLQLPLQVAYEVSFFLMRQSENYSLDLQTYMLQQAMQNLPLPLND